MIYILLFFLAIQIFFIYILNQRRIFSPSLIVTASFFLSAFVLITNWRYFGYEDVSFECVLIVSFSIVFMTIGEFIYKSYKRKDEKSRFKSQIESEIDSDSIIEPFYVGKSFLYFTIFLAVIVTISRSIVVYKLSQSLGNNKGFLASFSYVRMYVNAGFEVEIGRIITYPAVFVKAACLYCIYVFCHNKVYCNKASNLLLIPGVLYSIYTLTTTARTGILEIGCAFAVIYYAFVTQKNGNGKAGNKKIIRLTLLTILILGAVFIITGNIRSLAHEDNSASDFINYAGSPLIVFSRWLKSYDHSPVVGYATAPGLINILNRIGLTNVSLSHSDIYSVEDVLASSKSNLKTWLKAPIQDFYLIGMFFSRFILGIIYGSISNYIINPKLSKLHPGRFIFTCLLFYPLFSACISDKYGNYIQLETIYMALLFYYFSTLKRKWNTNKVRVIY